MSEMSSWPYHWPDFGGQNALLKQLLQQVQLEVILQDVERLTSLRPDAHRGVGDCLHFGGNSKGQEVLEASFLLLMSMLRLYS